MSYPPQMPEIAPGDLIALWPLPGGWSVPPGWNEWCGDEGQRVAWRYRGDRTKR